MRFFVKTDRPVREWFGAPDRRASTLNSIARLETQAILLISREQHLECDEIAACGKDRYLLEDLRRLRASTVVVNADALENLKVHNLAFDKDPDGVIPEGTSDSQFDSEFEKVNSVQMGTGPEASSDAFRRIFGVHLSLANQLVIVDPYAASNLRNRKSEFAKILEDELLPQSELAIVIHTTIDHNFYPEENQLSARDRPEHDRAWFLRAKADLAKSIETIVRQSASRNAGLIVNLYFKSKKLRDGILRFPHDRHFEFRFPRVANEPAVSDCFALGNGLDLFSDSETGSIDDRGADVYASTPSKMWRSFRPETHQKGLRDGYIGVLPEWFGSDDCPALRAIVD
jgi:hypothetical protein